MQRYRPYQSLVISTAFLVVSALVTWRFGVSVSYIMAPPLLWVAVAIPSTMCAVSTDGDRLGRRWLGVSTEIATQDLASCTYKTIGLAGYNNLKIFYFDFVAHNGNRVVVKRWGWGARRRTLFQTLEHFVQQSGVKVDTRTSALLEDLAK